MTPAPEPRSRPRGVFVTGTDTGIGKTWVSLGLMSLLKGHGLSVAGMKPVSAGCEDTPRGLRNEDALMLMDHASVALPYELVNPAAFAPPIAPHIAAEEAGTHIDLGALERAFVSVAGAADACVVEGAGGWLVPLGPLESFADLVERLALPVVLVVGIRLGCLNHALLTVESIERRGVPLLGWVANHLAADAARADENVASLDARIAAPRLAAVDYARDLHVAHFARALDTKPARSALGLDGGA